MYNSYYQKFIVFVYVWCVLIKLCTCVIYMPLFDNTTVTTSKECPYREVCQRFLKTLNLPGELPNAVKGVHNSLCIQ